ncbi:S8 family serine peptidase [Winogradskyella endarachnes]|uniref:S8 family serine peptidase n=1 Tax=Winogradskyella endarachnes TaxID=2681965 RepID=A0A6L6UAC8_9FLAO|nr:S8 family serine peptidase [Winogradskyella endarachnes]MUU78929.1 S8 family serine peptidase [Winogradskyella endarachnes]
MKHILLTIALLSVCNFTFSQKVELSNLSEQNKELLERLQIQEQERLDRISSFLQLHPNVKANRSNEINTIFIYDIVNGRPIYKATDNLEASKATKTNRLQSGGSLGLNLDGTGMTVGVWDGGPAQASHTEFMDQGGTTSRVTIIDNTVVDGDTGFSSHGTHVSGTVGARGVDSNALGMAPNINIKSYNWNSDETEMVSAVNASENAIILSNHSYGVPVEQDDGTLDAWWMGAYTQDSYDIDEIAKSNPKYLIVASAGNSGTVSYTGGLYSGYDKLTTDKNAKNNLVVANANPTTTEQPVFSGNFELTNLVINNSSSQGPSDDLRIKPDIAADGTNLFSPIPTDSYATYSGTSMASPNTTGTLALIQQYYFQLHGEYMNASTLKGLVCHTAIDDIAATGPDPKFGWGFLDAKASAETILDETNSLAVINELTMTQDETYTLTFSAQAGDNLIATLCWTDMPGDIVANGTLNDQTPRLVNDLDLRITVNGTTYFPWKLDYSSSSGFSNSTGDNIVDNVEKIEFDAPVTGVYTLTVSHKGTLEGNAVPIFGPQTQDYSLIVTGNNLTLGNGENTLASDLVIYPNPSNGAFTVNFSSTQNSIEDVKINIYDTRGRMVFNKVYSDNTSLFNATINLNEVEGGMYIVNITKGNSTTSQKIIIE